MLRLRNKKIDFLLHVRKVPIKDMTQFINFGTYCISAKASLNAPVDESNMI